MSIAADATIIARIVKVTDSDDRGLLFKEIAERLTTVNQFYTASMFTHIAEVYGYAEGGKE